jgi:hypothetical protein
VLRYEECSCALISFANQFKVMIYTFVTLVLEVEAAIFLCILSLTHFTPLAMMFESSWLFN